MEREEVRDSRPGQRTTRGFRQHSGTRQPTTLRGIFPDRPIVYHRNFIKENVRRVKQPRRKDIAESNDNRNASDNKQAGSKIQISTALSKLRLEEVAASKILPAKSNDHISKLGIQPINSKRNQPISSNLVEINNISHRSVQTELSDDLAKIYSTGVIKYPTALIPESSEDCNEEKTKMNHIPTSKTPKEQCPIRKDDGSNQRNFIRNNIMALTKSRPRTVDDVVDAPVNSHDRRNKLHKSIKSRKDEELVTDEDCPPGHVLLPEEERKETLRVLHENYALKIQELNLMPVRNDTLKLQKRKMDLEFDLKKIDEGIKVFQRPKVYVKVDA